MKTRDVIRGAAAFAAMLALAGCKKDLPQDNRRIDYSNLKFEVQIGAKADYGGAETRAVKPGWVQGDQIAVYFDGSRDNELRLTYDEQQGWAQDDSYGIASLSPSGSAQALHATHLHDGGDNQLWAEGDLLFTDTGSYTFDGQTVRVGLDMSGRITSRITVEGLTEPYAWVLGGPDLSVTNRSELLFEGSFDQALRTLFEPSGINRAMAGSYVADYHEAGSASFFVLDRGALQGTAFVLRNYADGKTYTRTYSTRELEPGKAVVIQGPEGDEAGLWTDMTVSINALQSLIDEAYGINYSNYTGQSLEALFEARDAAEELLYSLAFTEGDLAEAREALQAAMDALVERPYRAPTEIYVSNAVDGVVYVTAGEWFNIYAYASDANGEQATNPVVGFDITEPAWMYETGSSDNNYYGAIRETAPAGAEVQLTISAAADPSITGTFTVKVAGAGELRGMFLSAVAALPAPDDIDYDDGDAIDAAYELFYAANLDPSSDQEVMDAYTKLDMCGDVYYALPFRLRYSFSGNTATVTPIDEESDPMTFDYVQNGAFPNGTYTAGWAPEDGYYYQYRLVLNSDGTFAMEYRAASDPNGANATDWEPEGHGTYINDGTQAAGGMLYLTYADEESGDGQPSPDPGGRAYAAAAERPSAGPHRLFGR